jgi:hypothetical protein
MAKVVETERTVAKRLRVKFAHVHFGMFTYGMTVVIGPFEGAKKFAGWKQETSYDREVVPQGMVFDRHGYEPVLWLPRVPRTAREYGTLAHEVFHVVCCLMRWAAVPLTEESEEAFTHALGFGVTQALEGLRG